MIASLAEEAEAINWYAQRISVEPDDGARTSMENAQQGELPAPGGATGFSAPEWTRTTTNR